jgi:hypothetical protein
LQYDVQNVDISNKNVACQCFWIRKLICHLMKSPPSA